MLHCFILKAVQLNFVCMFYVEGWAAEFLSECCMFYVLIYYFTECDCK